VVVAKARKQEELQSGGSKSRKARGALMWWQKWELEGKLPSPPPFLFLHFFLRII
jgi:hypothetical protein